MTKPQRDKKLSNLPEGAEYLPKPAMPRVSPRLMLKTSPTLRRPLPTRLLLARSERKVRRLWASHEGTRRYWLGTMESIVAGTDHAAELEQLALAQVIERDAWDTLFWQPWEQLLLDEQSREHILSPISSGRAVILTACHTGPFFHRTITLSANGVHPATVAGEFWFEPPSSDMWGRRLARWRRGVPVLPVVRQRGSFKVLATLAADHVPLLLYFDMPGRQETRFLGKPAMMVNGTARLAVDAEALIVPIRCQRVGHRVREEAFEPLDARDFASVDELHQKLADVHTRLILEHPAQMSAPSEFGWGNGATPEIWRPPSADSDRGTR
ncbi:MAG TPA: hypothetical protein VGF47_10385 [Solirubrobacteraceae bacterium]|jgi:hypothetical protein